MPFIRISQKILNPRILLVAVAVLFCGVSQSVQAQRYNGYEKQTFGKDLLHRSEIGAGYILTSASFKFDYLAIADSLVKDTSMSFNARPTKLAYRIHLGSGRCLSAFSDRSALILSYGLSYEYLQWSIPGFEVDSVMRPFSFFSHTFGSELFFDYKTGAEATLDPEQRIILNVGAGILPAITRTNGDNNSKKLLFTMRPAVRVEFGLATNFINFKLQAMGIWGNVTYVNQTGITRDINADKGLSESYDIQIKGQSQFVLSLILSGGTKFWGN